MQQIEPNSIDCSVTDPPYGYSFMGKDWDKAVPSVDVWRGLLRVLKPGAFAFVMSSPRADVLSHMIVNLSDAGFRTDFTPIYWAYASGFPKAMNISKAVDKRLGVERTEVIGERHRNVKPYNDAEGWNQNETKGDYQFKAPASEEAKLLDGSYGGFQPKPAVEVIIVAMKPLSEKTYVDQALKNQRGITWLDDCRLPFQSENDKTQAHDNALGPVERFKSTKPIYEGGKQNGGFDDTFNEQGRFPANLLVSDDCLNNGKIIKTHGERQKTCDNQNSIFGFGGGENISDLGSFSRYFSLDAWFEKQIKKLPLEVQRAFPFIIEPKASKTERNNNLSNLQDNKMRYQDGRGRSLECFEMEGSGRKTKTMNKNFHPTVKPLQLMSYLITLGSRSNDLVIDPFVGSGTTCLAAKMLGRRFLGIELNAEYVKIAESRVNNHRTLFEFSTSEVCV